MDWSSVIADPVLAELPFKVELNEWGKIEMSPATNSHSLLQTAILFLLRQHLPTGKAFVECSIQTTKNVKVADVVWCSREFFMAHGVTTPYARAPEIVIEVASPSNRLSELRDKMFLYFAQGADEVWICAETGEMTFHGGHGELPYSGRCPAFPKSVEI
ncbi:hypothetical protein Thiowin_03726 [Thiorhodovibrio winogradskyi]|uniref:Putative restriction endonuclease domain-containing protein n=1 Tax=Thiorhodovibrio winogradskyi TaxID=77007 RepID=A0ABZ0SEV4_9GAMM|nr:Uma2 family endonuclease [Thiorhodovibrio winogradskyi]